ncbi:hypothetical protein Tco_0558238 [Tanacetum coccineum]
MVDESMVVPAIEEVAEPVVEAEEEQVIALVVDMEEEQMDAPEEVWEVNEELLIAYTTPPTMLAVPPPSVYEVGGPSTAANRHYMQWAAERQSKISSSYRLHLKMDRWERHTD